MSDQNEYPTFPKEAIEYGTFLMNTYSVPFRKYKTKELLFSERMQAKECSLIDVSNSIDMLEDLSQAAKFNGSQDVAIGNRLNRLNEVKLYLNSL